MASSPARFERWFQLILTMLDGHDHTAIELADALGTTRRNLYYVLRLFRGMGFRVVRDRTFYYIDPRSPFLQRVASAVEFADDEVVYLHALMSKLAGQDVMASVVKHKLERYYDIDHQDGMRDMRHLSDNIEALERAMEQRRVVILRDYSSPHSHSVSDRVVEPFLFQGAKTDVRAFEIKSKQNKTFKIARIGRVEVVDTPWFNTDRHREVFTDMFMFSGEEQLHVKLRLSLLAHNLMLEEYPRSAPMLSREDDNHWIFEATLVNYVGISRFILGLFDEITILGDEGLRAYVRRKIADMSRY